MWYFFKHFSYSCVFVCFSGTLLILHTIWSRQNKDLQLNSLIVHKCTAKNHLVVWCWHFWTSAVLFLLLHLPMFYIRCVWLLLPSSCQRFFFLLSYRFLARVAVPHCCVLLIFALICSCISPQRFFSVSHYSVAMIIRRFIRLPPQRHLWV